MADSRLQSSERSPKPAFTQKKNKAAEEAEKRVVQTAKKLRDAGLNIGDDLDPKAVAELQRLYADYLRTQRGKLKDEPRIAWKGFLHGVQNGEKTKALNSLESFVQLISLDHKLGEAAKASTTQSTTTEKKKSK